jgi:hypothetical protein
MGALAPASSDAPKSVMLSNEQPETMAGMIDEVAVYDRALTAAEVAARYAFGPIGFCQLRFTAVTVDSDRATLRLERAEEPCLVEI